MKLGFLNFKIKPVVKEAKVEKKNKKHSTSNLTSGVVELTEDGDFVVNVKDVNDNTKSIIYKFTGESYKVYGKTVLYSKKPDKKGRYTVILKTRNDALLSGDYSMFYNPFRPGSKVKGKILTILGEKYFDLVEVQYPDAYTY